MYMHVYTYVYGYTLTNENKIRITKPGTIIALSTTKTFATAKIIKTRDIAWGPLPIRRTFFRI